MCTIMITLFIVELGFIYYITIQYQGLIDSYRRRGHVTSNLAKFKSRLKIVEFLNMHSAVQTAVTRYTQHYGSYMPSSPLESISPVQYIVG